MKYELYKCVKWNMNIEMFVVLSSCISKPNMRNGMVSSLSLYLILSGTQYMIILIFKFATLNVLSFNFSFKKDGSSSVMNGE